MAVDSSMRNSSGYTIITLRGNGETYLTIPEYTTAFHYTLIAGGGAGGGGNASSTRGGGGGAGEWIQGWSTYCGSLKIQVGYGGSGTSSTGAGGDSYLMTQGYVGYDTYLTATAGKAGDSTQIGHGGYCATTYEGGAPDGLAGGGGGGMSTSGFAPTSSETGGVGGTGDTIQFFDFTLDCCGGGGGCGVGTTGGSATHGGGTGGYTFYAPTAGTAGTGAGGGGGYIYDDEETGIPEFGAPDTLNVDGGASWYALGGSHYGGGSTYPAYSSGTAGGGYDGSDIDNRADLLAAISTAETGAVIYIVSTADIALNEATDEDIEIPAGVTIASNRGISGSDGGLIRTTKAGTGWGKSLFMTAGDDVRLTGLRMQGETLAEDSEGAGEETFRIGFRINDDDCIVDNCDFEGFAYANIFCYGVVTTGRPYIHHNYIHGSHNRHEGYGVNVEGGDALVEGNYFYHNRHHVTGGGQAGEYYTFRYNKLDDDSMLTAGRQACDVHERATSVHVSGERYDIYNNTYYEGQAGFVHVTSPPVGEGHFIHHNIFYTDPTHAGYDLPVIYTYDIADTPDGLTCTNNKWASHTTDELVLYEDNTGLVEYDVVELD